MTAETVTLSNGADPNSSALAALLTDGDNTTHPSSALSLVERDANKGLPLEDGRIYTTLADLSLKVNLPVDDLYNRGRSRGLLIDAPYRTAAASRAVYADQVDELLAPKRGNRAEPQDPVLALVVKLVKRTRAGVFTSDEALTLIEAISPKDGGGKLKMVAALVKVTREGNFTTDEFLNLLGTALNA